MSPWVVLIINDNLYGLMCKLSLTCRFVHWHRLGHVLVSRLNHEERRSLKVDQDMCKELHQDGSTSRRDEEGRAQDAPSLEDLMLEACHPRAHGMMKTSSKKRFPHGVWGSYLQVFIFIKQEHPRKVFPL